IEGIRLGPYFPLERIQSALKYQPEAHDKFLVSFPRTGTTWVQQIGYLLFHNGIPPSSADDFHNNGTFLELRGADVVKRRGHQVVGLPKRPKKTKYTCRNPKNTCVSLFYHTRRYPAYEFEAGKFEDFFDVFLGGNSEVGEYFDDVLSWYECRNDPNGLFIHYENLKSNLKFSVLEIAEFVDRKRHKLLLRYNKMLERVLEYSSINFMKGCWSIVFENLYPTSSNRPHARFTRNGRVGDWRKHFTDMRNARIEEKIYRELSGTNPITVWEKHSVV
ncbi:unnamed protein product, partial [Ixodes hexagonus]